MDRPLVWRTADNSAVDDRSGSSREPANLIAELRQPQGGGIDARVTIGNLRQLLAREQRMRHNGMTATELKRLSGAR